jgi:hypothetical protein
MNTWTRTFALCCLALALGADSARAAKPEELFEQIFGAEAKKVAASSSKIDDVDFGAKLLASSKTLTEAPEFRLFLYEKAFDLACQAPKGYPTAKEALDLLEAALPNRKADWDAKRLELYKAIYAGSTGKEHSTAGEDYVTQAIIVGDNCGAAGKWSDALAAYQQALGIATAVRSLNKNQATEKVARAEGMKDLEGLKERLLKDPDNAPLRASMVRAYVEADDPASAMPLLNAAVGEPWQTYVPLATKDLDSLPTQVCLELGNWYKTLAFTSKQKSKTILAKRTRDYFSTYVRKLQAEKAPREALTAAREKANAALREIGQDKMFEGVSFRSPGAQRAFEKAIAYLWSQQAGDGAWLIYSGDAGTSSEGYYNVRSTSAALLALLEAGVTLNDERMMKGIRYLDKHNTSLTEGIGVRCMVWSKALKQKPGNYYLRLQNDLATMVRATTTGGFGYSVTSWSSPSNNNSWCAPWGVAAGDDHRLIAPKKFWQFVLSYWTKQQRADGGWGAGSFSTGMGPRGEGSASAQWTVLGTTATALAIKELYGPEAVRRAAGAECEPLRKGLAWLERNLKTAGNLKGQFSDSYSYSYYSEYPTTYDTLWQLSQLGLLTGRTKIGEMEWYPAATDWLISTQDADGSWAGIIGTSRAMLFLINGEMLDSRGGVAPLVLPMAAGTGTGATTKPATATSPIAAPPTETTDPAKRRALASLAVMKARLAADPGSQPLAKEIVRLYVVELEDPASAAAFADQTGNVELKKLLPLLAKPVESLGEAQCLALGEWLAEIAPPSSQSGRKRAFLRAAAYLQQFLKTHTAGDPARLKADLTLKDINNKLAEIKD